MRKNNKRIFILIIVSQFLLASLSAQKIDRNKQPAPGPPPNLELKDPMIYKLPNGITVLIVEDHRLPKVSASYYIDLGSVTEGQKVGTLSIMGEMLNEGTRTMSKDQFASAVDRIGASLSLSFDGCYTSALTRYFFTAFDLLGHALKEPAFSQESFDKVKARRLINLQSQEKNTKVIASRVDLALAYGKKHPNGEFESEESIRNITLQDVKNTYTKYIGPSRGYLTIVGDIKPEDAKNSVAKIFSSWTGSKVSLENIPDTLNPPQTEIDLVDVPDAVQSEIHVLNLVNLKLIDPDYFPALLANYILGGGPQGRLFMNLREKHGFTYGAYSSLDANRLQSLFDASASVRNIKTDSAVTQFLVEINRIRTERVTDEELANAKALYIGAYARGLEDPRRSADLSAGILIDELPADFYKTYLKKVNAVSADDIQRSAQKYIDYNHLRIVIVGNKATILPGLQNTGFPIKFYDKYADIQAAPAINK